MSIRPELNLYGFANATAVAVSRTEAADLLCTAAQIVTLFIPIVAAKQVKKKSNKGKVLLLFALSVLVTTNVLYADMRDCQLAYT